MFALQGKTMWNGQIWVNQTKHLKHQTYWWFSWPHWCASIFNTTVDESWWGFSREALVKDDWFGGTLGEGCLFWWNFNFTPPMRSSRSLFPSRWTPFGKIMSVTICTMQCICNIFKQILWLFIQQSPLLTDIGTTIHSFGHWNGPCVWQLDNLTIWQLDNLISNLTFSWSQNLLPLEWPLSGIW